MKVTIFTDGACSENPGPGGWAAVVINGENKKILSGLNFNTTNNRMELYAVLEALCKVKDMLLYEDEKKTKKVNIEVNSDSTYVVEAINKNWLASWKLNKWRTKSKEPVKNKDIWEKVDSTIFELKKEYKAKINFVHVRGHAGNKYNEMCDKRAREEAKKAKKLLEG